MNTGKSDVLIIGGPLSAVHEYSLRLTQQPFTFDGLAAAYGEIPKSTNVIIALDDTIFTALPSSDNFESINPLNKRPPEGSAQVLVDMALYNPQNEAPVYEQVQANIDRLAQIDRRGLLQKAAAMFLERILRRALNAVASRGEVFLLFPEETASHQSNISGELDQRDDLCLLIKTIMPGICVYNESVWNQIMQHDRDNMFGGIESNLAFCFDSNYEGEYFGEITEFDGGLPDPTRVIRFLPEGLPVEWEVDARDRAGQWRILTIKWGLGKMLFAPVLCWYNILKRLAQQHQGGTLVISTKDSRIVEEVDNGDLLPCETKFEELLGGELYKMLMVEDGLIRKLNTELGYDKSDGRRTIQNVKELAFTIDSLTKYVNGESHKRKKSHERVTVVDQNGCVSNREISGEAIRKIIAAKSGDKNLSNEAKDFLKFARQEWRSAFKCT